MYYLLGYKLLSEFPEDNCNLLSQGVPTKTKRTADNTFILTVDGDVSFEPSSVKLLLDQIKSSEKVGVVCGRIHPMGSGWSPSTVLRFVSAVLNRCLIFIVTMCFVGLLVWYQRFEYAIAHWLHKTAEHVMGVVLCTPGAFSLFRASALMDKNVIKKFSKDVSLVTL